MGNPDLEKGARIICFLVFFLKTVKKKDLTLEKVLHGKNQWVCKNQKSKQEELAFTVRRYLVD